MLSIIKMCPIQNMTRYNPTPVYIHQKQPRGPSKPTVAFGHPPQPLPEPSGNETGRDAAYLLGAICQMCDVTLERPAFQDGRDITDIQASTKSRLKEFHSLLLLHSECQFSKYQVTFEDLIRV